MLKNVLSMPRRSLQWNVGKEANQRLYFHRQYEYLFPNLTQDTLDWAKTTAGADADGYTCLRWDFSVGGIAFQFSPDFDTADEPTLTKTVMVKPTAAVRVSEPRPGKMQILHHKWLWVLDDYEGFDVEAAKARSQLWLPHVEDSERRQIHLKEYWDSIKHRWENE